MAWYIVDVEIDNLHIAARHRDPATLPPRPPDAQPANGDPCTPWYQAEEHVHFPEEDGKWGAHLQAVTPVSALLEAVIMVTEEWERRA